MSKLDDAKRKIHETVSRRELIKNQQKILADNVERLDFCAFMALEKNEHGKELMDAFRKMLMMGTRYNDPDLSHTTGYEDCIRSMFRMIESHKEREQQKAKS